jgi:uncharacterized protein with GYD domain
MPLFMTQFTYTPEAWAALVKRPEDRRQVLADLLEGLGGKLIGFYYAFSEYDGIIIYEVPDVTTAGAVLLAVVAPGHNKAIKTTALLTVEEAMESMHRVGSVRYRPPTASPDSWRPYHD